tara:strand:+ start:18566 stop:19243 length:678 start_codon:yes stop_codon:yes gene_type:complete
MDELLSQLDFNFTDNFSITSYVINIIIAAILLYILSIVYRRYGNSISNRNQLSKVLIIVGLTTFIIISIVKSSLALSLGLVGALSIIRFRTAIKEPEELGYFFIAICIGLGMGASQLLPTLIGFLMLVVIIIILSNKKLNSSLTQNLVISTTCNKEERSTVVGKISAIIEENSKQVELKRLNHSETTVDLNFLVNVVNLESIQAISRELLGIDTKMNITFIDNEI